VIKVSGTQRQVGQQIGEQMRPQLHRLMVQMRHYLPPGVSWDAMLHKGRLCLAHSRAVRLLRENRGQRPNYLAFAPLTP
jgi:hypothetical protein